jgi:hypothetical protein
MNSSSSLPNGSPSLSAFRSTRTRLPPGADTPRRPGPRLNLRFSALVPACAAGPALADGGTLGRRSTGGGGGRGRLLIECGVRVSGIWGSDSGVPTVMSFRGLATCEHATRRSLQGRQARPSLPMQLRPRRAHKSQGTARLLIPSASSSS